jgi:hypothetical protein
MFYHRTGHIPWGLTLILLMWRIGWAPNSIPIYIHKDATLHSLLISGNCSTCFGWLFHTSSGAHTTVSTASGICHTVTANCRYRGRVGTGFSVLWVAYATHSTLKPQVYLAHVGWSCAFTHVINAVRKTVDLCCKFIYVLCASNALSHRNNVSGAVKLKSHRFLRLYVY